jgi:hypothetical protein
MAALPRWTWTWADRIGVRKFKLRDYPSLLLVALCLVEIEVSAGHVYRLSNGWRTISEQDARAALAFSDRKKKSLSRRVDRQRLGGTNVPAVSNEAGDANASPEMRDSRLAKIANLRSEPAKAESGRSGTALPRHALAARLQLRQMPTVRMLSDRRLTQRHARPTFETTAPAR